MLLCRRYYSWLYQLNGTYSHAQKQHLRYLNVFPDKILGTYSSSEQQEGPEFSINILTDIEMARLPQPGSVPPSSAWPNIGQIQGSKDRELI